MNQSARLIQNLRTVGAIESGQKLFTSEDEFSISSVSSIQKFIRLYYNENRNSNIDRIRQLLHNAKNESVLIMKKAPRIEWEEKCTLESLLSAMESFMKGLANLMETYRDDVAFRNKLSITLDDTSNFLQWARSVDLDVEWSSHTRPFSSSSPT
jgi:uncharacterized protein YsxB (DUF464 family)